MAVKNNNEKLSQAKGRGLNHVKSGHFDSMIVDGNIAFPHPLALVWHLQLQLSLGSIQTDAWCRPGSQSQRCWPLKAGVHLTYGIIFTNAVAIDDCQFFAYFKFLWLWGLF